MKRILVTGADGMLGNNIIRELIKRSYVVHALVEPERSTVLLDGLNITIHKGDITDPGDLKEPLSRVDAVIHTAGLTALWPARSELSWKINFEAVKILASLCQKNDIKRFVHIGTANSFGYGTIENPGNEEWPYSSGKFKLDYMDSKVAAQEYLLKEHKEQNFPVIILNPTFMLGKYDSGKGSNKAVSYIYKGIIPGYTTGGKNWVYVGDVAVAAVNALKMGRTGECYITGNLNMTYKEGLHLIAETLGVKPPRLQMPKFLMLSYGWLSSLISHIAGGKGDLSYRIAKVGCEGVYYSSEKAVKELKMPQSPLEKGILESIEWFKEQGIV